MSKEGAKKKEKEQEGEVTKQRKEQRKKHALWCMLLSVVVVSWIVSISFSREFSLPSKPSRIFTIESVSSWLLYTVGAAIGKRRRNSVWSSYLERSKEQSYLHALRDEFQIRLVLLEPDANSVNRWRVKSLLPTSAPSGHRLVLLKITRLSCAILAQVSLLLEEGLDRLEGPFPNVHYRAVRSKIFSRFLKRPGTRFLDESIPLSAAQGRWTRG